ncbi:putative cleavage and polyadenylation specificity factor subunit 4-like protein isoform X5 [Rhinolophus sinicus]|uniref:putative cleavage and polyadenylation specificity factor subunit 4-like protein isoform X5 n=1 Tax=Rhinolophus sinicus TaxID=89399 RepID=UPI003D793853
MLKSLAQLCAASSLKDAVRKPGEWPPPHPTLSSSESMWDQLSCSIHSICPEGSSAHSGTTAGRRWWCVSTGSGGCARRVTNASSCTSTTSPGCLSATSTPSSLLNWPRSSAPPASAWRPRKPPPPTACLLHPCQMRPQEQLVSYCLGPRVQVHGPCYRCRKMGHYASNCGKTDLVRVTEASPQVCLGTGQPARKDCHGLSVVSSVPNVPVNPLSLA